MKKIVAILVLLLGASCVTTVFAGKDVKPKVSLLKKLENWTDSKSPLIKEGVGAIFGVAAGSFLLGSMTLFADLHAKTVYSGHELLVFSNPVVKSAYLISGGITLLGFALEKTLSSF